MSLLTNETIFEEQSNDDILEEARALIEQNTLESCELAIKKLALISGWKDADELLNSEYYLLEESAAQKRNSLSKLESNSVKMKQSFKKVSIWKAVFFINIFLMIISTLVVRFVMSDSEIFMVFGIPVLVTIVTLLVLFTLSLIKIRQHTHKFEMLTIGRKTNIFRDKIFFVNKIQHTEIEILNAQKYIISVELILNEVEKIKN